MATVSVTIDGKTYRMACDTGQEDHLAGLANQFDQYIAHLKSSFGEIGDHRLSVMAGIMVMDEMSELQKKLDRVEAELHDLQQSKETLFRETELRERQAGAVLSRTANRIEEIVARIAPK